MDTEWKVNTDGFGVDWNISSECTLNLLHCTLICTCQKYICNLIGHHLHHLLLTLTFNVPYDQLIYMYNNNYTNLCMLHHQEDF